jgi:SHS2 domain-containing protein
MDYEILDHPADIGFRVRAPTRDEAYAKAACALFSLLATGPREGDTHQKELVEVEGEDECALLYELLEAALILFETERFHATRARVTITDTGDGLSLSARLAGSTAAGADGRTRTTSRPSRITRCASWAARTGGPSRSMWTSDPACPAPNTITFKNEVAYYG